MQGKKAGHSLGSRQTFITAFQKEAIKATFDGSDLKSPPQSSHAKGLILS